MKQLAVLLLLLSTACAGHLVVDLPGIPPELDPSLALSTADGGGGHACPVAGEVLTAAHVMWDPEVKNFVGATYSYRGQEGQAIAAMVSLFKDVVKLEISGEVAYLPRGKAEVGGQVFWFEYDFRTKKNALRARRRVATVLREVAGWVVFDAAPTAGASGTCLINERGEVVGIISVGFETEDGAEVGAAPTLP